MVAIFVSVIPSVVLNVLFVKSNLDCVVNVFDAAVGVDTLPVSLNDCVAETLTLKAFAPPLDNPPIPNNSVSTEELTLVEPPLLESKSIKYVPPLS